MFHRTSFCFKHCEGAFLHCQCPTVPIPLLPLQHKLCAGANRLSSCLLPTPTADGLAYNDLPAVTIRSSYGGDSNPQQRQRPTPPAVSSSSGSTHVWQFSFSLHKAMHVGPTGFEPQRQPLYQVARVCIFDRRNNRFIGENESSLPPKQQY